MPLEADEMVKALTALADVGDEARALRDEIKASREDGEVTPEERRRRRKATKALLRKVLPIGVELAADVLD